VISIADKYIELYLKNFASNIIILDFLVCLSTGNGSKRRSWRISHQKD